MKVLFIVSGNSRSFETAPFIKSQAESIREKGVEVHFFHVKGRGALGYLRNLFPLFRVLSMGEYSLIHAHYSLCGYLAGIVSIIYRLLSRPLTPIIVSLMGSDVNGSQRMISVIRFFGKYLWVKTIVKSEQMMNNLGLDNAIVVPNGVDLNLFCEMDMLECKEAIGLNQEVRYVLFGADPAREVKNYPKAERAFKEAIAGSNSKGDIQLISLVSVSHETVPLYINSSDLLVLTSKWEGSPNIVKETMACNVPIVSLDVGDVRWLLSDLLGCYVCSDEPAEIARLIRVALNYAQRTNGRNRIIELGLDSSSVADKLIEIYQKVGII